MINPAKNNCSNVESNKKQVLEPDAHPRKVLACKIRRWVCIMRTQRQSRNLDTNARFLLLLQQKKKAGEYESLPKSITILGSTGRPDTVALQRTC